MNTPSTLQFTPLRRLIPGVRARMVSAMLVGLVASLVPAVSHADSFSPKQTAELLERLNALEAQLDALREQQAQLEQSGLSRSAPTEVLDGPDGLWLPPPPEPALSPEEFEPTQGYTLLAEINGRFLVKDGDARRMLSAEEFERFKAVRAAQVAERIAREQAEREGSQVSEVVTPSSPPPAPPPASNARPVTRLR